MFSFVYEDPCVELNAINEYMASNNTKKIENGLMILSGGETMFEIAKYFKNLTAIDINDDQINMVNKKIELMNTDKYLDYINSLNFTYDEMFRKIKNGETFDKIFSRENLIKEFGENAVRSTSDDFAGHFKKIHNDRRKYHNLIFNQDLSEINKKYDEVSYNAIKNTNIKNANMIKLMCMDDNVTYDFIQTSNITDWMDFDDFCKFCENIKKKLNKNGILVMRRLLSDNLLYDNMHDKFSNCRLVYDETGFYKETVIFINS